VQKGLMIESDGANSVIADSVGMEGGGDASGVARPSFLVQDISNVNSQIWRAKGLLTMWDFLEHKGRIKRINVVLQRLDAPKKLMIVQAKDKSRYFDEGRSLMSWRIKKRLGRFQSVPGLMETLTYDPKKTGKQEAWKKFGKDTRRFLNSINQYRKRRGWHRLHYLWVVEVQKQTGYPHVHIFFPNLRWLAPSKVMSSNWEAGRANIESPKKIRVNCAAYISKYLRKMHGWTDLHLALLWNGGCRMYGFSKGFSIKEEKKPREWQRWNIVESNDINSLKQSLIQGGFIFDDNNKERSGV
jgi:hypothetical protein